MIYLIKIGAVEKSSGQSTSLNLIHFGLKSFQYSSIISVGFYTFYSAWQQINIFAWEYGVQRTDKFIEHFFSLILITDDLACKKVILMPEKMVIHRINFEWNFMVNKFFILYWFNFNNNVFVTEKQVLLVSKLLLLVSKLDPVSVFIPSQSISVFFIYTVFEKKKLNYKLRFDKWN